VTANPLILCLYLAYYGSIFANAPQKDVSTLLTSLWAADPFKPKWAILARAYTSIRNSVGKANAPLLQFLETVGPAIGMLKPEDYLKQMGWIVVKTPCLAVERVAVASIGHLDLSTKLSAWDLVQVWQEASGQVCSISPRFDLMAAKAEVGELAGVSLPASGPTFKVSLPDSGPSFKVAPSAPSAPIDSAPIDSIDSIDSDSALNPGLLLDFAPNPDLLPALHMHQNNALLAASGDHYPYNDQFNPGDQGLYFDPGYFDPSYGSALQGSTFQAYESGDVGVDSVIEELL
jgi:hypothetical protein